MTRSLEEIGDEERRREEEKGRQDMVALCDVASTRVHLSDCRIRDWGKRRRLKMEPQLLATIIQV